MGLGRSFRGLWAGTAAANLADGMVLLLLPLLALASGAGPGGVAAVTAVLTLAWPVFGLHAGWIVDRFDRKRLLMSANTVRSSILALLAIAYLTDVLTLPVVLAAAAIIGALETLVDTALTATIPMVVAPLDRGRANARIEAVTNLTNSFVGPPLAGALAAVTLAVAAGASAFLYSAALIGLSFLTLPPRGAADRPTQPVAGLGAGLRFLWRHPILRPLTLFTAAMNIVWAAWTALFIVYAVAPGPLGLTEAEYGFLLSIMAAGGLLAAVTMERLRRIVGVATLLIADCVGTVLLVAPAAIGAGVLLAAIGAVVASAGASVWRISAATARQNVTPDGLLGRVYAASRIISWGVIPLGATVAGVVAELTSLRAVFQGGTVLAMIVLVAMAGFLAVRGRELTSAIEGGPEGTAADGEPVVVNNHDRA